jgi:N-acetylmuramoyl-L-alanine amidase
MRPITVLDPGHGGTVEIGRSTPFGVRGLNGLVEKNVTLDLARRVAERIGTSLCLTRHGDVNLSLGDRAQLSRDLDAPAFVSIHATAGGRGMHGSESWVHTGAGTPSFALADDIRGELSRVGIPDRGRRCANLAVLNPARHRSGCGACLIEVEHLDDEQGAWRLGNPYELDAVADGLARGIERYLQRPNGSSNRSYSFGRVWSRALEDVLDLTDYPTNVFDIIDDVRAATVPRQIRKSDHQKLEKAWDCMMKKKGLTVTGVGATAAEIAGHERNFRVFLRGGLADSPLIRGLFQDIACDDAHPLTFHVGEDIPNIFIDALEFDPARPGVRSPGHHTWDLKDCTEVLPRVSGNPRDSLFLMHQNLVHGLREARQCALGDAQRVAHDRGIDDENLFRQEQGQRGVMDHNQPVRLLPGPDLLWNFDLPTLFEAWRLSADGATLLSIDYSP